jgi:hypothetical protein
LPLQWHGGIEQATQKGQGRDCPLAVEVWEDIPVWEMCRYSSSMRTTIMCWKGTRSRTSNWYAASWCFPLWYQVNWYKHSISKGQRFQDFRGNFGAAEFLPSLIANLHA